MSFYIYDIYAAQNVHGPYTQKSSAVRRWNQLGVESSRLCIVDENWREREKARHNLIDLSLVGLEPIKDHFLFVSKKLSDTEGTLMVSFTLNELKGKMDRQQSAMKIGRYLISYYPMIGQQQLTEASRKLSAKYVRFGLKFAKGSEAIRALYLRCGANAEGNGVDSCMTHGIGVYNSLVSSAGHHPVDAYGGPDLEVAYMERDGKVVARSLCWPEKKLHGRVYGDSERLTAALQAAGYEAGSLVGARLKKIPLPHDDNAYVAPYIDHHGGVRETADYLVISDGSDGRITRDPSTNGYVQWSSIRSVISRKYGSQGRAMKVHDPIYGESHYAFDDEIEGNTTEFEGLLYLSSGGYEAHWYTLNDGTKCPSYWASNYTSQINGVRYRTSELMRVGSKYVTRKDYFENYAWCEMYRTVYPKSSLVWMEHQAWWHPDQLHHFGVTIDGKNYARELAPVYPTDIELQEAA